MHPITLPCYPSAPPPLPHLLMLLAGGFLGRVDQVCRCVRCHLVSGQRRNVLFLVKCDCAFIVVFLIHRRVFLLHAPVTAVQGFSITSIDWTSNTVRAALVPGGCWNVALSLSLSLVCCLCDVAHSPPPFPLHGWLCAVAHPPPYCRLLLN